MNCPPVAPKPLRDRLARLASGAGNGIASFGSLEIARAMVPVSVSVFRSKRNVRARITEPSVTAEAFDPARKPICVRRDRDGRIAIEESRSSEAGAPGTDQ